MKALILVNNSSGFECDGCSFWSNPGCKNNGYIVKLIGDCGADSIYKVEECEVTNEITE